MTPLAFVFAGALAIGLLGFCAWCVYVVVTKDLDGQKAKATDRLVFWMGRALIWAAALLVAGGLLGGAAAAVWKAVG